MAQTTTFYPRQAPAQTMTKRLVTALAGAWTTYWTERAERATVYMLHSLDNRTLKDIGIDRSEIESVARHRARERRVEVDLRMASGRPRVSV